MDDRFCDGRIDRACVGEGRSISAAEQVRSVAEVRRLVELDDSVAEGGGTNGAVGVEAGGGVSGAIDGVS